MTDRQSTHSHDCWGWGPKHYECAVRQVKQLASELRQAMDELDAAQAEARVLRERSAHVDRGATRLAVEKDTLAQALARVRELAAKWRAAPQDPDEPLLAMAADELEAAISQPAEPARRTDT